MSASSKASATIPAAPPVVNSPGIGRRLAALLYEALLLIGVLGVLFVLPHVVLGAGWKIEASGAVKWLHVFLVLLVYFIWQWRKSGQTLAMRTWKIKLVSATTGTTISPRQAALRYVLAWPSLLLCGLGLIWALVDRDRQFLHDRLAGTRLIQTG